MANEFDWTIENNRAFELRLDKLGKATSDFRIPFRLISSDFYRSQKQLFSLKSRGMYEDLSEKPFFAWWETDPKLHGQYDGGYKEYKEAKVGFVYPILVGQTKDLSKSTLSNKHKNSIYFLGRQELEIGTNIPYGKYHQSDKPRTIMPQRKFVFIDGGKGDKSKGSGINGRRQRWISIIDDHVEQLISGRVL